MTDVFRDFAWEAVGILSQFGKNCIISSEKTYMRKIIAG
jgi:hypothetical protein